MLSLLIVQANRYLKAGRVFVGAITRKYNPAARQNKRSAASEREQTLRGCRPA